jgi:hypothetical protein
MSRWMHCWRAWVCRRTCAKTEKEVAAAEQAWHRERMESEAEQCVLSDLVEAWIRDLQLLGMHVCAVECVH